MPEQDAVAMGPPATEKVQSGSECTPEQEEKTPRRELKYDTEQQQGTELCGRESPFKFKTMQQAKRTRPFTARRAAKPTSRSSSRNVSPLEDVRPSTSATSCTPGDLPASTETPAPTAEKPVSRKRRSSESSDSDSKDWSSCKEAELSVAEIEDGLRSCQLLSEKYGEIAKGFYSNLAWCSDESRSPLKVPNLSPDAPSWAGPTSDSSDKEKGNIPAHYGSSGRSYSGPETPISSEANAQTPPQLLAEGTADSHGTTTPEEQVKRQAPDEPSPAYQFPSSHPTGPRSSDSEDSLATSPEVACTDAQGSGVEPASPTGSFKSASAEPFGELPKSPVISPKPLGELPKSPVFSPKPLPAELFAPRPASPVMEPVSVLTKSAGKLRLAHLLEEGPLHAAPATNSTFNLKTILATVGKLVLVLAVLGVAWQSPNIFGSQYATAPVGLASSIFTFPGFSQQPWRLAGSAEDAPTTGAVLPAKADILWPISWWNKQSNNASEAASPAAIPPAVAKAKATSTPITEPAGADPPIKPDPPVRHQQASLWAELTKAKAAASSAKAESPAAAAKPAEPQAHRELPSELPVSTGSCPAPDLRAAQYTAAVGAAVLAMMVVWSITRCMVSAKARGKTSLEDPCAIFEEVEECGPPAFTRRSPARALPLIPEDHIPGDGEMLDAEPGAEPAISASIKTALRSSSRIARSSSRLAASIARSVTGSHKSGDEDEEDDGEVSSVAHPKTVRKTRSSSARRTTADQVPETSAAAATKSPSQTTRRSSRLRQAAS